MPTLVGFNYLKNPAHPYARELIRAGELGDITLFRGTFDQDLQVDPDFPFTWRHERAIAGSGALGDMGSHTLAFAQYLLGDVVEVCGMCETFIRERPLAGSGSGQTARAAAGAPTRNVENDDVAQFLMRFACGAIGTIGTSRIGTGRKMGLGYEIQGTRGALFFTQERMNELQALPPWRPGGRARLQDHLSRARAPGLRRLPPDPGQQPRLQRPEDPGGARADLRDRGRASGRARLRRSGTGSRARSTPSCGRSTSVAGCASMRLSAGRLSAPETRVQMTKGHGMIGRYGDQMAGALLLRMRALVRSEAMPEVDLAFIARQLERLVNDVAGLKDDMTVVMARLDRLDATTHSLVTEVRAMHSRHDRVA